MKKILFLLCILGIGKTSLPQTYLPLTGGTLTGGLLITPNASYNGRLLLGSASGSIIPYVGGASENNAAGLYFTASPASNIDNTNFTSAFYFDAFKNNAQSSAMTGGNIVNFLNNNVSKFKVDYSGATTIAGALTGTSAAFTGIAGNYTARISGNNTTGESYGVYIPAGTNSNDYALRIRNASEALEYFSVRGDGNVGIGTTTPDSKLTVAGKIHSQEVKVSVAAGADFVFDSGYQLRSLAETEKYISANKHLPEIASAEEMKRNGLELGEMNIKLLQKIEELTLHLIEQNKKIELQGKQLNELQSSNNNLLYEVQRLKSKT